MKYEKVNENHRIYIEEGETERDVLRAIAVASFELARPVGLGWMHFQSETTISPEEADCFINDPPSYGDVVLDMDYVQGRQAKTTVSRREDYLELGNRSYEMDRGDPEPMLERAKEILVGETCQPTDAVSTAYMYQGKSLDLRMAEYGFHRRPSESDWDFRKRIFPGFYQMDRGLALEFLMGKSATEWGDLERMFMLTLAAGDMGRAELAKFAEGFARDPSIS